MSGQRRANWRTEMDAVIDAHRSEVARQFDDEAEIRGEADHRLRREFLEQSARIGKLENRKRIESWVTVAYMVGLAIWWAVTR